MPSQSHSPTVFSAAWFEKHQDRLLWLLNSPLTRRWFRWCLSIRKHDVGYDKPIVQLHPHAYTCFLGEKADGVELITDFRTHSKYAKRLRYAFAPLWWAMHAWDWAVADRWVPELSFGYDTLTAYPDPHPETNTVDGRVHVTGVDLAWTNIRTQTGTAAVDNGGTGFAIGMAWHATTFGNWSALRRSIFLFNTAAIGSGSTISAAVLSLYGNEKADDLSITPNIDIYTSNPASNTALVGADFSTVGTTSQTGSPISYSSFTVGAYNDFTFNATGISNVSKTGISKFGARNANYDAADVEPTDGSGAVSSYIEVRMVATSADTVDDPKLVVTYTTGGGGKNLPGGIRLGFARGMRQFFS